jgi:hypothetical protein
VRARVAIIVGAALLLAVGCGQSSSQRPAVARYVRQVNRLEAQLARPLASITKIGTQFAHAQGLAGGSLSGFVERSAMDDALRQIAARRARLASLPVPPPAVHLRLLLLQQIDAQVRMAQQLQKLVVFLPHFSGALRPLGGAMTRLEAVLSQQSAYGAAAVAAVYAEKAAALRSFRSSLEAILAKLRPLKPPAVSRPDYDAQVRSLSGMSADAAKLADALSGGPHGNLQPLLTTFGRDAASAQGASVRKAHLAAVRAYDRQLARINRLSQDAEAERLRLADSLQ